MTTETQTTLYRHPSDVARLTFSLVALAVLLLLAVLQNTQLAKISTDILELFSGLPDALVNGLVGLVQLLATLMPVVVVFALFRSRSWQLSLLMVLASLIAAVTMALLTGVVDASVPAEQLGFDQVDSWFIGSQYPSATYLAMLTALLVTASPWLTRSWRRAGWVFIVFVMFARILSSVEVPVRNLMLLAVGAAAGSLALVVFGAPRRRVNIGSVRAALGCAGLEIDDVQLHVGRHRTPTFAATTTDGRRLFVKVLGRDQRDSDVLLRTWRSLTLKGVGGGTPSSPRRAVDHEALAMSIVGGVAPTPTPVAVLGTTDEASVLASTFIDGVRISEAAEVSDALMRNLWSHVAQLQQRRLAHGTLDATNVMVDGDRVTLVDFAKANIDADDATLGADVAELLASLTLLVGVDRAVAGAAVELPVDVLERAVPLLQAAVLSTDTRRAYKDRNDLLDSLRDAAAAQAELEQVELAPVRRITIGGAVSLVGSLVLVWYVVNLASNWDQTWEAFTSADLLYAVPIILMMISTYFSGAMSLIGATTIDLIYTRTVAVMFGQSYLNRFTPANAGGMAMRVRYLQLNGLETAVAASAIALTSGASGVAQVVTIVVFLIWGGASDKLTDFQFPDMGTIVVAILVLGLIATGLMVTRWGKTVILPWVTTALSKIKASIGDLLQRPGKLGQLFGGALLGKLANVVSFWASMLAFGIDISFPKAGAMYIIATTIGSAVPTPGGVGGVEAALTAALIAYGVDNATAAAIVLFFRTLTFWLPTIPGYGFFRYTRAKGIV
jgi:undecaprenyl-diphosphatase